MGDIATALETLQDTPVPNILVVGGLVFLFLAVVGQFVGEIKVTPERQKMAGILGGLLLLSGIVLYVIPPSSPIPGSELALAATPTPAPPVATPTNPPPIPTETSSLTATPTSTATLIPATDTPVPSTLTPTHTPSPKPSLRITSISNGEEVAQNTTLIGEYPAGLENDLWVFVLAPDGRYYPQSTNACAGERTPKVDGRWEVRVRFGTPDDAGKFYTVVLTIADKQASQFVVTTLKDWCKEGNYPGWDELPQGITEKHRIDVRRTDEIWGRAPVVSNTQLAGQVSVDSLIEGDEVPQSMEIAGTYDADHDIWVLVHAPNGRWYPQSTNACKGVHTQRGGGEWQVSAGFGGEQDVGKPFDIVVVLASTEASAFFDTMQRQWCKDEQYPGLLTIELPQGIEQKSRSRVYRK